MIPLSLQVIRVAIFMITVVFAIALLVIPMIIVATLPCFLDLSDDQKRRHCRISRVQTSKSDDGEENPMARSA